MSKTKLIDRIEPRFNSRADAERAVNHVVDGIGEMVRGGETVVLKGFGTFKAKERAERMGRNIATGEPLKIAASKSLGFKSSFKL